MKISCDWNILPSDNFIVITGAQEAGPVHRVLLFQHPEAGDQPPAEVFLDILRRATSPEMTHLNICLCPHSGSEALLYHLSEVKGMSLWKQKFEPLGLDAAAIEGTVLLIYMMP